MPKSKNARKCATVVNYCDNDVDDVDDEYEYECGQFEIEQQLDAAMKGNRMFTCGSKSRVAYCDEELLQHSPYFSLLFEVHEGPIEIDATRDFDMFERVLRFVKYPKRRSMYLKDVTTREAFIEELEYYSVMGTDDIRGIIGINEQKSEMIEVIAKVKSQNVKDVTGFTKVFRTTLARKDIGLGDQYLILKVLVKQAWIYSGNMFRKYYGSWCAQKHHVKWFLKPHTFWSTLDIGEITNSKRKIMIQVKEKFPKEIFDMTGIDCLFDGTATYVDQVDMILLMRGVLEKLTELMEPEKPTKATLNKIKKYLADPCKIHMSKK